MDTLKPHSYILSLPQRLRSSPCSCLMPADSIFFPGQI